MCAVNTNAPKNREDARRTKKEKRIKSMAYPSGTMSIKHPKPPSFFWSQKNDKEVANKEVERRHSVLGNFSKMGFNDR